MLPNAYFTQPKRTTLDVPVPERIQYKLAVRRCLQGRAPKYFAECCTVTSDVAVFVLLAATSLSYHDTVSARSVLGLFLLLAWNCLSDNLRDPTLSWGKFRAALKAHMFSNYQGT